MRVRSSRALVTAGAVAASLALVSTAAAAAPAPAQTIAGTTAGAASSTPSAGAVPASTPIDFEIDLALTDPAGAAALVNSVSDPSSSSYRQYLSPAQWEAKFSPSGQSVSKVEAFLKQSGFTITGQSSDRMRVSASGTAAQVEQAFSTQLNYHTLQGHQLILNQSNLSVPSSVAGVISGITGISQTLLTPDDTTGSPSTTAVTPNAQPAGFRNAQPCSTYYGQSLAAAFPTLAGGFSTDPSYAPCGYTPSQLRGAYGDTGGQIGTGVTLAVLDAYISPTLFADTHEYAKLNDPTYPLKNSQFKEMLASSFDDGAACGGQPGWYGEQTLDVEAAHAMAPGATILAAAASDCEDGLNDMLEKIVDKHSAEIVSNSYGDTGGDLFDTASDRQATDQILQMAAGTGVTVMYSSGDDGDNYIDYGIATPDYPASSPYATAVGGTSLAIGSTDQRLNEYGWSTGKAIYCNVDYATAGGCPKSAEGTWSAVGYDYGGGGGTSYQYNQPSYQAGRVPREFSEANGTTPMRTIPDVAMDADPSTGMLVGETQTFPDGTYYDQYRIGGTSLASPLMAGVVARADGESGTSAGFLNPALYAMIGNATDFNDITSPKTPQDVVRSDYLDGVDSSDGIYYSARTLDDQGSESYCSDANNCTSHAITLKTESGYDNMTGLGTPGTGFVAALAH